MKTRANKTKRWFSVTAEYKAIHLGKARKRHLWERRVFIFHAAPQNADKIAAQVAKGQEHQYESATGDTIKWTMQNIVSVLELFDASPKHGTEVDWGYFERVDKTAKTRKGRILRSQTKQ